MIFPVTTDCPSCGCNDTEPLPAAKLRWGSKQYARRRCNFCGREFRVELIEREGITADRQPVYYHILRCPACGSRATRVTSTRGRIRHHKCKECQHTFKSVEIE